MRTDLQRDSDKGKAIERWRRKVTGLPSLCISAGSTTAGPPESNSIDSADRMGYLGPLSDEIAREWNEDAHGF